MLAEVVKIERVIREVPEGGAAWNLLCEVVNMLLEITPPPPPAGLWRTSKEDKHHEHLSGRVAEETETAGNRAGIGAAAATASADNSGGDEHSGHSADDLPDTERIKITPEMSALQRFEARYGRK
ncbi:hypothetical protein [uncultured Victivallis sp.]|uniref:hypothetical protein n=1 Tax=uncultured Victivallis sp. TaxID=354118 RepID=UPI0025985A2E|nr:hypothetical protein [uncultured Victivallis sp.]